MSSASYFQTLDRIKPVLPRDTARDAARVATPVPERVEQPVQPQRALVLDAAGRTTVTMPIQAGALNSEDFLTRINGRLVGAEEANRNGQFWTTGDLVFGVGSVAGGPLNWLHEERHIVGALTQAQLITPPELAEAHLPQPLPYIAADSVMWSFLYPKETAVVRQAAQSGDLFYSMECITKQVQCYGPNGCGKVLSYADTVLRNEQACSHIRDRSSARRLINPVFQGAAVIVPPVRPGWANANADVMRRAGASEDLQEFTDGRTELAAQIHAFVSGE